jgi:hypothetical protein
MLQLHRVVRAGAVAAALATEHRWLVLLFGHAGHAQAACAAGLVIATAIASRSKPSTRVAAGLTLGAWALALVLLRTSAPVAGQLPTSPFGAALVCLLLASLLFLGPAPMLVSELRMRPRTRRSPCSRWRSAPCSRRAVSSTPRSCSPPEPCCW